jgi:hypothetical protein
MPLEWPDQIVLSCYNENGWLMQEIVIIVIVKEIIVERKG